MTPAGLVISHTWPFLASSPDEFISCDCCGSGLLEIKCPLKQRGKSILSAVSKKGFCLELKDGSVSLRKSHPFYWQVQTQLFLCNAEFADFCIRLFRDDEKDDLFIEKICPDEQLWASCLEKAKGFFSSVLLSELVGKIFISSSVGLSALSAVKRSAPTALAASSAGKRPAHVALATTEKKNKQWKSRQARN